MKPSISLITATYNNAGTIADTIKSLEVQSIDFEWLVQDGLSQDNTLEMVEKSSLAPNIVSEKDRGLYDALNKGIKRAQGDILGFCHADDVLASPEVLAKIQDYFEQNPNCQGIYTDLEYWNEGLTRRIRRWKAGKQENMFWGWMPPHPTVFMRRACILGVGAYRIDMGSAADYEWLLRAIRLKEIHLEYLPMLGVKMRVGGMSSSGYAARRTALKGDLLAWKMNGLGWGLIPVTLKKLRKIKQFM